MRHIEEFDARFKQHRVNFCRIDKTDTSQLDDPMLLGSISAEKPPLIYLHIGVNDIHKGIPLSETIKNIASFEEHLAHWSPSTKLIISAPLLNGKDYHHRQIVALRQSLERYVVKHETNYEIVNQRLIMQPNLQFHVMDSRGQLQQNGIYFHEDGVHLSNRGKRTMLCCFRDSLHQILRVFQFQD